MSRSVRKIVVIDEERCNGCGECVPSCAEGAIRIVDGKARLVSETYCDGLGACLGTCPQDAIRIEERAAEPFDERAVAEHLGSNPSAPTGPSRHQGHSPEEHHSSGHTCPGARAATLSPHGVSGSLDATGQGTDDEDVPPSQLGHWPVQLRLVPPTAPYLAGANLILCADCVPFAVADFHNRYLAGRVVLVGCPKLDDLEAYREKLKDILRTARPASMTVLRMEVPCCGGLAQAAVEARAGAHPDMPMEVHVIGIKGGIDRRAVP